MPLCIDAFIWDIVDTDSSWENFLKIMASDSSTTAAAAIMHGNLRRTCLLFPFLRTQVLPCRIWNEARGERRATSAVPLTTSDIELRGRGDQQPQWQFTNASTQG
jgi:hypothetical protein